MMMRLMSVGGIESLTNEWDCHCWCHYPNEHHKHRNGKWKCVDRYECIRDLVEPNTNYYDKATHCRKKGKMKKYDTMTIPREEVMSLIEKLSRAYIKTDDDVIELNTKDFMFILTGSTDKRNIDLMDEIMKLQTYVMYSGGEKLVSLLDVLNIIGE